ncbi:MAG: hypothetical protein WC004_04880 [Candidatus Absconditabacterales bacterium]
MIGSICILLISLLLIVKGSINANKYATRLAQGMAMSKYIIGLIIVSIISVLPESLVSINAVLNGVPEFAVATLFGSNVSDLTLVFAIVILFSGRKDIKVESHILKNNLIYPYLFLLPVILGLDGHYARREGIALIGVGILFYFFVFKNAGTNKPHKIVSKQQLRTDTFFLAVSLIILLVGAHFTVDSATTLAQQLGVPAILIGILIVGVGTTIPELSFSLNAAKNHNDELAIGDVLGTVLIDATIIVGVIALIEPFDFPQRIIHITGIYMMFTAFIITSLMSTGRILSKKEALFLIAVRLAFVGIEYAINT